MEQDLYNLQSHGGTTITCCREIELVISLQKTEKIAGDVDVAWSSRWC